MNNPSNHYLHCNCRDIINSLLDFSIEIISDNSEGQWEKLQILKRNCACDRACIHMFCPFIHCMREDLRGELKLSSLIMNMICFIYKKQKCLFNEQFLESIVAHSYFIEKVVEEIAEMYRILVALAGRSEFMQRLVKFGLISSIKSDRFQIRAFIGKILHYFMSSHMILDLSAKKLMVEKILKCSKNVFLHNGSLGCCDRMFLATIAIQATQFILQEEENTAKDYIHCLRLYFAGTRDPLLTINEVRCMLYVCLSLLEKLHLFESHCEEYVKLMPESPVNFEPRSLTDLARCEIRDNISKGNLPLSVAVEKLSLPRLLKKFVLGDIIEMSLKSKNISREKFIAESQLAKLLIEINGS